MPIGAFKLNGIAKYLAPAAPSVISNNVRYEMSYYLVEGTVTTSTGYIGTNALGPTSTTSSNLGFSILLGQTTATNAQAYFNASTICCYEFYFKCTLDSDRKVILWSTNNSINNMSPVPADQSGHMILFQDANNFKLNYFRQFNPVTLGARDSNWHHLAVQSNGNGTITVWYDGTQVVNFNVSTWTQRSTFYHCMGYSQNSPPVAGNSIYFDEIVITHGSQKYTPGSNFTPYTTAQSNTQYTLGLFHCESTTQKDDLTNLQFNNRNSGATTATGVAVKTDASAKFGSTSLDMSTGTGGFTSELVPLQNLTGNYTIEFWAQIPTNPIFSQKALLRSDTGTGLAGSLSLRPQGSNIYDIEYSFSGDNWNSNGGAGMTWTAGVWYHCCVMRSGTSVGIFFNGSRKSDRVSAHTRPFGNPTSAATLGVNTGGNLIRIDSLRISNTARYTYGASFTVPTSAFTSDANTLVLYHFEGVAGSTIFRETT